MSIIVNIVGIALIGLVAWWFWFYKKNSQAAKSTGIVNVVVDGGVYEPSTIYASVGELITLRFLRKDTNPCAEKVIFSDLDINADLPVDKTYDISLTPDKKGEFEFTCQMAMYRGKLVVSD